MSSLLVIPDGKGLYDIKQEKGGPAPRDLSGKYTSYAAGNLAIKTFQAGVRDKVDGDAKGKSRVQ